MSWLHPHKRRIVDPKIVDIERKRQPSGVAVLDPPACEPGASHNLDAFNRLIDDRMERSFPETKFWLLGPSRL